MILRTAGFAEITTTILYSLLRLRSEVFVVEQNCVYPDLDGRDLEPGTLHVWLAEGEQVTACLRVLDEPDGAARIGRVVVAPAWRGKGLGDQLVAGALTAIGDRPVRLESQSGVTALYARHGFTVSGPDYVEDGIPHTPMFRPAPSSQPPPAGG
ncbi:UPF0039 protein [Longispora fulva]|uniref:ElaA protein n=1 Tax=Longispora fulva TaxID=619741 RepID=A0A8J7GK65_9ACTN|nr:GNAT family N-acetyltransferase [Longispora fulva]MBG6137990.1 ElaA protein [Longispora fulva]GIG60243.1 UPF0039 protein [Longispora fulva]